MYCICVVCFSFCATLVLNLFRPNRIGRYASGGMQMNFSKIPQYQICRKSVPFFELWIDRYCESNSISCSSVVNAPINIINNVGK
jgi:hypothetical protein